MIIYTLLPWILWNAISTPWNGFISFAWFLTDSQMYISQLQGVRGWTKKRQVMKMRILSTLMPWRIPLHLSQWLPVRAHSTGQPHSQIQQTKWLFNVFVEILWSFFLKIAANHFHAGPNGTKSWLWPTVEWGSGDFGNSLRNTQVKEQCVSYCLIL